MKRIIVFWLVLIFLAQSAHSKPTKSIKKFDKKSAVEFTLAAANLQILLHGFKEAEEQYNWILYLYDPNNPQALARRAKVRVESLNNIHGGIEDSNNSILQSLMRLNSNYLKEALAYRGLFVTSLKRFLEASICCQLSNLIDYKYAESNLCLMNLSLLRNDLKAVVKYSSNLLNFTPKKKIFITNKPLDPEPLLMVELNNMNNL
jgi:hypothetical protein